jgi:anti-sigma B factor antagonist
MKSAAMSPPFRVDGELTIYRAAELAVQLSTALAEAPAGAPFVIDLAGVTEMDSAGAQLLMAARRSALAAGRELKLAGHSEAVREVFDILELDALFADVAPPSVAA